MMSLSHIFKSRVIQLALLRNKSLSRSFGGSMVKFRYTLLPPVIQNSSLFHTFNTQFIRSIPLLSNRQVRLFSEDGLPPTWEEVNKKIIDVLSAFDKIAPENVSLGAHFVNDLGLDSLDIVEIVMSFEDFFDVEITDDELETIFSGKDAADLIGRKLEIPFPEAAL
ncbi:Acyl carrier protein 2, mitochondrial-like [Oopsacas minuta]|uniref:Acyl carrier protein n=1 Tax=Oopsacas minuta TaxID=111878 RepID=A0AAV7KI93_9METZ|nr:Acyl carrier protein 2, mitochondrial-like [Oopsacas minuta]